ncbi:MAG: YtxH domain-containing protein [Ignavibacteriales bacterium]|nr:MAG: YtxH domain-containing protein [Ignavibacteriales bacterium]
MAQDNNLKKGLLIGFLAGGAIGAILALLYAPKSGKELRNDIRAKTDDYLDDAERFIAEAKVKASELINEGKRKSEKLIVDAKTKSGELLKDAEKIFSDAKTKASSTIHHGKEIIEDEGTRLKSAVKAGLDAYKESKNS